jgi:tRNA 2-selenouridine synthase
VHLLQGGYKKYRHWAIELLQKKYAFKVLGGYTGSGKTVILNELKNKNHQVLDLENLANHRGSAFGNIGLPAQPTNEMFENLIAVKLHFFDINEPIWIEDECSLIGRCKVPKPIYDAMREAKLYFLNIDLEQRAQNILKEYGAFDKELLKESTLKLHKRLGDKRTREAIEMLEENDLQTWTKEMLIYYDKTYLHGTSKRNKEKVINIDQHYISSLLKDSVS